MPNNASSKAKVKTRAGDSPLLSDMIEGVRTIQKCSQYPKNK